MNKEHPKDNRIFSFRFAVIIGAGLFVIGTAVSAAAFFFARAIERERLAADFNQAKNNVVLAAEKSISTDISEIRSISHFYAASRVVEPEEFRKFVQDPLTQYEGLYALGWVPLIPHARRIDHQNALSTATSRDIKIFEIGEHNDWKTAEERAHYYPVSFIEPLAENRPYIGFDIASDTEFMEAMNRSRDRAEETAFPWGLPVKLRPEDKFLIAVFYPVYEQGRSLEHVEERRAAIKGFALGLLDIQKLIESALNNQVIEGINVDIYYRVLDLQYVMTFSYGMFGELAKTTTQNLSFADTKPDPAVFQFSAPLDIAGYPVKMVFSPMKGYIDKKMSRHPWWYLIGGILFTVFLAGYAFNYIRRSIHIKNIKGALAYEAEEHKKDERMLTTLISNLPGMVYRCRNDENWTMEFLSDECENLTGYRPEDLIGNSKIAYADLLRPEDRDRIWQEVQKAIETRGAFQLDYRIKTSVGKEKWVWEQGRGVYSDEGQLTALEGFIIDITENRKLKEQLFQAQKMEGLGRLAGGVAHDFNNLITVLLGNSELLLDEIQQDQSKIGKIQEIKNASKAASSLTKQLLAFSRKQIMSPRTINLNDVIINMDKMLRRLISESVELTVLPSEGLSSVRADPGQIEQILVNLVVNAQDAMPEGGKITVTTSNIRFDRECTDRHAEIAPGEYVLLTVSDTGEGIPPEIQEHIFEPFFTTKEEGKGTGLGLATVFGIVQQNNGHIRIDSALNQGTTFEIYFPEVFDPAEVLNVEDEKALIPKGSETVLVVEDNHALRSLEVNVLKKQGYEVLEAENGVLALDAVDRADVKRVHLLVTDVVMPKMGGHELAAHVQEKFPGTKVLYASGYIDNATIAQQGVLKKGINLIQKPFTPADFAKRVREVLDRAQ